MGLPGIPQPEIFWWVVDSNWEYFVLAAILAEMVLWICSRIVLSPFDGVSCTRQENRPKEMSGALAKGGGK